MARNKGRAESRATGTDMGCQCGDHCTCKNCTCGKTKGTNMGCKCGDNCTCTNCPCDKNAGNGAVFLQRLRNR